MSLQDTTEAKKLLISRIRTLIVGYIKFWKFERYTHPAYQLHSSVLERSMLLTGISCSFFWSTSISQYETWEWLLLWLRMADLLFSFLNLLTVIPSSFSIFSTVSFLFTELMCTNKCLWGYSVCQTPSPFYLYLKWRHGLWL